MPSLSRAQAAEQMNRLFPWATWSADTFGLYEITYEVSGRRTLPFRMWLPVTAPNIQMLVCYRLNIAADTAMQMTRLGRDIEASLLENERHAAAVRPATPTETP